MTPTHVTSAPHLHVLCVMFQVNDEQRIKCTVASVKPVDYARECKELIKAIGQYN